jgi:branched-chain amino acid transport system permease protein
MSAGLRDTLCTTVCCVALFGLLSLAETHLDSYTVQILSLVAINAILAVSLNLIYGFTGMFSLGHAGFMAIGAYVCTLLILTPAQKEAMWILEEIQPWLADLSMPFLPAVVLGGLVSALFGLFIALPVLRLGGDYLGIATLGFAEIIRVLITNFTSLTNGSLGIKGIPQYATLWCNYGWLVFTLYFVVVLLRRNVGNVFKAIRDDETAARTMGVNTFFYKVLSFTIGAFFAGVGGALMAALISTIDPKMFNFMLTFNVLMIVVAGGLGSITGSIIGSVVITFMLEWLRVVESPITIFGQYIDGIPGMRMVIFSLLLLGIILFRRSGLMGTREFSWDAVFRIGRKRS